MKYTLTPNFYVVVKAVVTGYAFFLISNQNHSSCVLIRNASAMCTNNQCKILLNYYKSIFFLNFQILQLKNCLQIAVCNKYNKSQCANSFLDHTDDIRVQL